MKVMYKAGSIYGPGLTDFPYKEGDYVTMVVRYWTRKRMKTNLLSWLHNRI